MFHPTSNLLFRLIRPHFLNNMDFFLLKKEKKKTKRKKKIIKIMSLMGYEYL